MKALQTTFLALSLIGATALSSCSFFAGAEDREKGTPIESTKTTVKEISDKAEDNEGKRFSVTGYLLYEVMSNVYTNRPQSVYICTEAGDIRTSIGTIDTHWAENGHNSVFVPADGGGDKSTTIFYDHEGRPFSMNQKVTISFGVSESSVNLVDPRFDRIK